MPSKVRPILNRCLTFRRPDKHDNRTTDKPTRRLDGPKESDRNWLGSIANSPSRIQQQRNINSGYFVNPNKWSVSNRFHFAFMGTCCKNRAKDQKVILYFLSFFIFIKNIFQKLFQIFIFLLSARYRKLQCNLVTLNSRDAF